LKKVTGEGTSKNGRKKGRRGFGGGFSGSGVGKTKCQGKNTGGPPPPQCQKRTVKKIKRNTIRKKN